MVFGIRLANLCVVEINNTKRDPCCLPLARLSAIIRCRARALNVPGPSLALVVLGDDLLIVDVTFSYPIMISPLEESIHPSERRSLIDTLGP